MLRGAAAWVGGAAAFVLAFGVLWNRAVVPAFRGARSMWRKLDTLHDLAVRELNHNGGSSIKDAVHDMAGPALAAGNGMLDLHQKVETHIAEVRTSREVMRTRFDGLTAVVRDTNRTVSELAEQVGLHTSRIDAIAAEQQHQTRIVTDSLEWQRNHENAHRRSTDHGGTP